MYIYMINLCAYILIYFYWSNERKVDILKRNRPASEFGIFDFS